MSSGGGGRSSSRLTNFPWRSGISGRSNKRKRLWKPLQKMPRVLIGVGNPGVEFQDIRHNIGRNWIDFFAKKMNLQFENIAKYDCELSYFKDGKLLILKPNRFMNMYGPTVAQVLNDFNLSIDDCCVIHDCFHTKFGHWQLKHIQENRGHPALTSIDEYCGNEFWRVKVGIGRPSNAELLSKYIINPFTLPEQQVLYSKVFDSILFHLLNSLLADTEHLPLNPQSMKADPELRFYKPYLLSDFNEDGAFDFDVQKDIGYWPGSKSYQTIIESEDISDKRC